MAQVETSGHVMLVHMGPGAFCKAVIETADSQEVFIVWDPRISQPFAGIALLSQLLAAMGSDLLVTVYHPETSGLIQEIRIVR